jgi:hypothetical protein
VKNSDQVVEIQVIVKLRDGRRGEAVFVRQAKIREIIDSGGGFGNFVRDLADSMPERVVGECCCDEVDAHVCPGCPVHGDRNFARVGKSS